MAVEESVRENEPSVVDCVCSRVVDVRELVAKTTKCLWIFK